MTLARSSGFGFPVRFKLETSDDPEFKTGVTLIWRKHDVTFMNDFKNPGLTPFETNTAGDDGVKGRYVRVTAVKLAPRMNDYIFALAEMQVFDDKNGKNLAEGRPVTALDSIEAAPRWRKVNLTDGIAPEARTLEDNRSSLSNAMPFCSLPLMKRLAASSWHPRNCKTRLMPRSRNFLRQAKSMLEPSTQAAVPSWALEPTAASHVSFKCSNAATSNNPLKKLAQEVSKRSANCFKYRSASRVKTNPHVVPH